MPSYYKRLEWQRTHRIKLDEPTINHDILGIVSAYGGQEVIAGQPMQDMIDDITTRVLQYLEWQREEDEQP